MGTARYEYSEGSSNKFWQIELSGTSFTTTFGKIGTPGTTSIKEWPDAATAKKEHDKLVAQKVKKGYAPVASAAPKKAAAKAEKPAKAAKGKVTAAATASNAFNPQLAKQIDANPDDEGAWAVYADWLQGQGDPRGELGVVQERLRASPKDKALLSAEKKLLKDHAEAIVGNLAPYMKKKGHIPGVLTKPDLEPDFRQSMEGTPTVRALWRSGYFQQIFVGHPGFDGFGGGGDDDEGGGGGAEEIEMEDLITNVLSNPASRFLSSLRLGLPNNPEDGEADYETVLKKIAKHEALTRLRTLYIGDVTQEEAECSWVNIGDVSKLYPQLKHLRHLTIRGSNDLKLGKIDLPDLRSLTIITGGLDKKNVAAIAAAKWPKLERLELWFGTDNYGGNCKVKDVAPILAGKAFPKLKHLGLRNCDFIDELAAAVPGSPIMKQIESLDLSKGTMTDDGVKKLVEGKASLAHLRRLDLSDNYIGKASTMAATITNAVRTRPQRTADEYDGAVYRYVALTE
ncbi:MAG: WGR domain-containing protein [Myxococcota bacterium]|nr:WGR domain-containing protein [Myxococcota bacterium]